ncbi:hypothetical protein SCLCIDRAFT_615003 [Scleroderma citrinum Foug A]|uniref:Uncharacterized protein n=1 Tax=Scleroderma citrinum Foug A TaxID=1036808 RepID=A0A0C2ZT54_9AGAM|nr:hypothetical protein SCLCIDRAFT_615003 [Scleroderma citrinum Foug A]
MTWTDASDTIEDLPLQTLTLDLFNFIWQRRSSDPEMRFGFTSTPCLRVHPSVDRGACCVPFSGVPPTANRRRCGQALCCAICLWGRLRLPDAPHGTATRSSNRHNIANGMRQPTAWASHEIRGATPAPPYQAPRSAARGTESLPAGMIASHVRSPLLLRHRCHTVSALCDMSPRRPGKAKPPRSPTTTRP